MHKDMHYAGTYALAKLAGLSDDTALKIGGSAQFVDDSGDDESIYDDKTGELFASEISTRYADIAKYAKQRSFLLNYIDQLAIWVPFHFLPGGKGNTLTQKLVCQPDSEIARAMIASHLKKAVALQEGGRKWGPHLIGVAAHVYADTFAHYGFSGVSSRRNLVKAHTIREVGGNAVEWQKKVKKFRKNWGYTFGNISTFFDAGSQSKEVGNDDAGMWQKFWKKSGYIYSNAKNSLLGLFGEISTLTKDGAMGHPGVASMPDFLAFLPHPCVVIPDFLALRARIEKSADITESVAPIFAELFNFFLPLYGVTPDFPDGMRFHQIAPRTYTGKSVMGESIRINMRGNTYQMGTPFAPAFLQCHRLFQMAGNHGARYFAVRLAYQFLRERIPFTAGQKVERHPNSQLVNVV